MKILNPKVDVGYIDIQMDRMPSDVRGAMESFGSAIPVMSLNDVVYLTNIDRFKYSTKIYGIPSVDATITDLDNVYTFTLKNHTPLVKDYSKYLNTGVVRFGYKDFATKFNILSGSVRGNIDSYSRGIGSTVWNYKWYNNVATKSFRDKSILDIIKVLCTECDMGLYVYENSYLTKVYPHIILHNMNYLQAFDYIIGGYTDNVWCIDGNYFLHIGDVDNIRNQDIAMYTYDYKSRQKTSAKPMIFRTQSQVEENNMTDSNFDNFIIVDWHVQTKQSNMFIQSKADYSCYTEKGRKNDIYDDQDHTFGVGHHYTNTYSGFVNHINPYMSDILNKDISANILEFEVRGIIPELNPFDVIMTYIYKMEGKELDAVNSGKKMVISFDVIYQREGDALGNFNTVIRCI